VSGRDPAETRAAVWTAVRSSVAVTALLFAYFTMPFSLDRNRWTSLVFAVLALAAFAMIFVRQVRRIQSAQFPVLRAVEALAMVATLFVVLIAATHVALSTQDPTSYSEALTRLDGIYFTVTVLATVGFGDITPVSATARAITTLQMLAGVALLGAGVRVLMSVATKAREARDAPAPTPTVPDD